MPSVPVIIITGTLKQFYTFRSKPEVHKGTSGRPGAPCFQGKQTMCIYSTREKSGIYNQKTIYEYTRLGGQSKEKTG
jgi:hypothetical protein